MAIAPARRADPALLVILAGVVAALHIGKLPPAIPVLRDALGLTLVQAGFCCRWCSSPACRSAWSSASSPTPWGVAAA
jgi:hypothetical protein